MSDTLANHKTHSWQTLHTDLLVLILKPLLLRPRTYYIPLICTHVCRHWRQAVSRSPSLWSYVDVSRGNALTELWLSNSTYSPIDVKLWQPPEELHTEHGPPQRIQAAIENAKRHVERWRSLDISFWCGFCMEETMAFLGCLEQNLKLDSLTVGPMGKTAFFPGLEFDAKHPGPFGALKIEPTMLRVDSYRFAAECAVFSTRLTTIEMFSVPDVDGPPTHELWGDILTSTPNLMSLTLWHQTPRGTFLDRVPERWSKTPILLPSLRYLSLSTSYLEIMLLLAYSLLPKLEHLRIDSSSSKNLPLYIGRLAAVAPCLSNLAMSFPRTRYSTSRWNETFEKFQSLRHLTFFEMDSAIARRILELENLPQTLTSVRLERTQGHDPIEWSPVHAEDPPTLSFVGYDNAVRMRSVNGTYQVICPDDYNKANIAHESGDIVYYSRESETYVGEDLAIGPSLGLTDSSESEFEDSDPDEENNPGDRGNELERATSDTVEDSDADGSSVLSWGTDASLASGDFYIIGPPQQISDTNSWETSSASVSDAS
ncbi:hypothetical protein FRC10_000274 [Ceratobasidium sp. 414]|nr:hypothetical protein FRC10_000274 [Ceratobasidium sp. 414]